MHKITHLAFADHLMVMTRGDVGSVQVRANILVEFGSISGLQANRLKSNLFMAGVRGLDRAPIEAVLGYTLGSFPFQYLGIPLAANRLRGADYSPLVERISDLIKTWTNLTLSYAGRLELI